MASSKVSRRRFAAGTAALSTALVAAPFVRGAYAAGKLSVGFWDHWVPTANVATEKAVKARIRDLLADAEGLAGEIEQLPAPNAPTTAEQKVLTLEYAQVNATLEAYPSLLYTVTAEIGALNGNFSVSSNRSNNTTPNIGSPTG